MLLIFSSEAGEVQRESRPVARVVSLWVCSPGCSETRGVDLEASDPAEMTSDACEGDDPRNIGEHARDAVDSAACVARCSSC